MRKQDLPSDKWIETFRAWMDSYGWLKTRATIATKSAADTWLKKTGALLTCLFYKIHINFPFIFCFYLASGDKMQC